MFPENLDTESEKIANAFLAFAVPFPILLLGLWYSLNGDEFWAGIIAFSFCFLSALGYLLISDVKSGKLRK